MRPESTVRRQCWKSGNGGWTHRDSGRDLVQEYRLKADLARDRFDVEFETVVQSVLIHQAWFENDRSCEAVGEGSESVRCTYCDWARRLYDPSGLGGSAAFAR